MKLLIGIPTAGEYVPSETVESLMNMKVPPNVVTKVIAGERVDKARNALVRMALEGGFTHLLFIDDDNPPPQDTIKKFLEADKDIICAPIPSRHPPYVLCVFEEEEIPGNELKGYKHIEQIDTSAGDLVQVAGCGMACTMIKRGVLEKLWEKHKCEPFQFTMDPIQPVDGKDKRTMSEDMTFCERAVAEGFEVWCDTTIRPPHLTTWKRVQFSDTYIK
jgi:hypothetical protein